MDDEGKISEEEHDAIEHHRKVMNTALEFLRKFKGNHKFTGRQVTSGAASFKRIGRMRPVQFLQIGEATGNLELRIEVFIVKRGEGDI